MSNGDFIKKFALEHPIISFLTVDCVLSTITRAITTIGGIFGVNYDDSDD